MKCPASRCSFVAGTLEPRDAFKRWRIEANDDAPRNNPARSESNVVDTDAELDRIEKLVQILDNWFLIPGTNVRVGLDAIVGLIPGAGDVVMLLANIHVVQRLSELGLPALVRLRMYGNVLIDLAVGAIPILGDIFDVAFKSNVRNLALARRYLNRD